METGGYATTEANFATSAGRLTPNAPRRLGHSPVLDGLRGIAIALVVLMHTHVIPGGYVGVDLFFALSGFLITTLLYDEWDRRGAINLRRFYGRRARRLLPALILVVLAAVVTNLWIYRLTGWPLSKKALTTLFFMNNWVAALGHTQDLGGLTPTWSLAQEEQFYLVWPALLLCMLRWRLGPRAVAAALCAGIAALLWASPHISTSIQQYNVYYSPADRSAELLMGCLGAVVWRGRLIPSPVRLIGVFSARGARAAERVARPTRLALCWGLLCLFNLLLFLTDPLKEIQTRTVYLEACAVGVLLIVNLLAVPSSSLARAIGWAPLRFLGRISYAMYLFHLPIYNLLRHFYPRASVDPIAAATFALSVAAAALSWRLVESRLLLKKPAQQRRAGVRGGWSSQLDPGSA